MKIDTELLHRVSGNRKYAGRKAALVTLLHSRAPHILTPHVFAQFLAQIMHESSGMRYTKEIWGPTAAQRRYEGRRDLGNTRPGDGKRFMGRDYIQCTGRDNYRRFTAWAKQIFPDAPDFEKTPDALLDPKWLGLSAVWYWKTSVPTRYVDEGNIEMVTRSVNGGLNGYSDRLRYFDRAALALLGFATIKAFQIDESITADGISGPITRAHLHRRLVALGKRHVGGAPAPTTPTVGKQAQASALGAAIAAGVAAVIGAIFWWRKKNDE